MVQVNLIGKKRREGSGKNWIVVSATVIYVVFILYFLGVTAFVVTRLYQINREIKLVDSEAVEISTRISANKEGLRKYVLSKYILERVIVLKNERFRYKDYLDQIAKLMPLNAVLKNVDFTTKGWVAASVSLPGVSSLKVVEDSLTDSQRMAQSEFRSVFSETVSFDKSGVYNAKLYFEIKPNGGK